MPDLTRVAVAACALALALAGPACRVEFGAPGGPAVRAGPDAAPTGEVWVYTSMYPEVLDALEVLIEARLPGVQPLWFQAGSEKVAQRVEAEWAAGGSPACLLMTSDPFWYARLADQGRLQPHLTPNVLQIDHALVDEDALWVAARRSLVVLAVNASIPEAERPGSFADLADPRWNGKITAPDPLASGTAFTWLAFQLRARDWAYVDALRRNALVAAGGNSAVLARVVSGERPVGVILLENLLTAEPPGVVTVLPSDGAVVVPGPIAMTADCRNPVAARAVYDLLMSPEGQKLLVVGDMYAALPSLPPPDGAPPLDVIPVAPWMPHMVDEIVAAQAEIKDRWAQ